MKKVSLVAAAIVLSGSIMSLPNYAFATTNIICTGHKMPMSKEERSEYSTTQNQIIATVQGIIGDKELEPEINDILSVNFSNGCSLVELKNLLKEVQNVIASRHREIMKLATEINIVRTLNKNDAELVKKIDDLFAPKVQSVMNNKITTQEMKELVDLIVRIAGKNGGGTTTPELPVGHIEMKGESVTHELPKGVLPPLETAKGTGVTHELPEGVLEMKGESTAHELPAISIDEVKESLKPKIQAPNTGVKTQSPIIALAGLFSILSTATFAFIRKK